MAIPDYQSLMLPVLRLAADGETRVPDAAEKLAEQLGLSVAEREEMLPSGRQRIFHNRIHWAKFYMTKAGLIDSPARGRFVASQAGRALLATNPAGINVDTLKTYPAFAEFYASSTLGTGSTDAASTGAGETIDATTSATPEEQIDAAQAVLHQALKADLLQRILTQSPAFFERAIVDLLVGMGYGGSHENAARRLGKSGDGGIDGVIDEDRLGLDRIYVQAKRYASHVSVGRPEVQGFLGSLVGVGAAKGVFVTTSSFSAPAIDFVRHLPQRIVLIDGDRLADLMIEHGVGVRTSRTVQVKRLDEDFFVEE
ncbi:MULTISPECIES: restriction endonuclease [Rhizobium/Agrobacterium group]|uniref:restriction endonuclease n=1 Tax=Rhizobium/Agrobacterium group TaxID=227290 RepID=UPI000B3FE2E4|nr:MULTISPECIES: restriction endonuclease [Rhizobium/Agrobacterium group]MCF1484527.1 restriction endonuclease [Allorhizobium ampelinum]NSZ43163.1 restriction endonuclease [Agrobacterium vitis]NTA26820.1 restriction endonuclease [Allorhizobium ampelinum]OVE94647.1 restriction endonuclease [Allorhizobium ampelinum]